MPAGPVILIAQALAAVLPAAGFSYEADFQTTQARVHLGIRSNDYVYIVTNQSYEPISRFRLPQYSSYAHSAPEGWVKEITDGVFEAWTKDPKAYIGFGQSGHFGLRVKSDGAVLKRGTLEVGFESGRTDSVPDVLYPALESRSYIFAVAAMGLGLIGVHLLVTLRAGRRGDKPRAEP
ncbi:MAG TPA: hypothetical protein VFJ30_16700 [Phycisphaerae bacterium]|nr:hypothetical protein [Phycisphaerae bacterium]